MSRSRLLQSSRLATRAVRSSNASRPFFRQSLAKPSTTLRSIPLPQSSFSTCMIHRKGIMPDTEAPAKTSSTECSATPKPVDLSDGEYHELADIWLENALVRFEELQDQSDELDVEYSSGVMTVRVPEKGTYVLNKQPPNKQIWLSSPLSGPKRYDWCVIGESQSDKEGTAAGQWVYARDGSTLDQLILEELEVDLQEPTDV